MRIGTFLTPLAALSLVATPALAADNPAASLSVSKSVRSGAPTARTEKLAGGTIVPVVLALAVIAGGVFIAVDNKNNKPKSP